MVLVGKLHRIGSCKAKHGTERGTRTLTRFRAPWFEHGVSANSSHLGLVDPEGVEPSHHNGPQLLRLGCLPVPSRIESAGRGSRTPTRTKAHHILSVGCLPFHHPGMSQPALVARGCVVGPEGVEPSHHDGHQHLKLACLPFHHGPVLRCAARRNRTSRQGPRCYRPPAGATRFHAARCRARVLRVNSEGATATGVGGGGTWCLVPTRRRGPD